MEDLKDLSLSKQQKEILLRRIEATREISKRNLPAFLETAIIKNFKDELAFFPAIAYPAHFGGPFTRIVINRNVREDKKNSRLTNYSEIKYPPSEIAHTLGYNRASLKGQSVFYGGWGSLPVTLETSPRLGDLYTLSKWQQKNGTLINHFPIFHNEKFYEDPKYEEDLKHHTEFITRLEPNVAEVTTSLLSLMTEVFMKPADKQDKLTYLFSALFADYYLNTPDLNVQCLYYPSVAGRFLSRNITCLPKTFDNFFECIEIHESLCIKEPDENMGGWGSVRISDAININPQAIGNIQWELNITTEEYNILKSQYGIV